MEIDKKLLYGVKAKIECVDVETHVGQAGSSGANMSTHRLGIVSSPKISTAALLFDLLFMVPGKLSVYESTVSREVYIEVEGGKATANATSIAYGDDYPHRHAHSHLPHLCYELSSYGENTELQKLFQKMLEKYNTESTVDKGDLLTFCDSYYYGSVLPCSIYEGEIATDDEFKAAFRNGTYKKCEAFYEEGDKYLASSALETIAKPKKTRVKSTKVDFIEECKSGKYQIDYAWPEELKGHIISRSFLDSFVPTPEFEEIVKKVKFRSDRILERMDMGLTGAEAIGKDYLNIMLLGKPGTGKTTIAYALSAATGMPVCTTPHNKHTDEDEYEGKTKIVDGKPMFVETDSLMFHENGGIDVCEEINLADPSVTMGGLGQKVEYPFIVKRNGYETKVRHPLNVVIATMNVGTNGSNPLNQALANRFKTPYILDDPTAETFIDILMKKSGQSREVCEWVYDAYDQTVEYLKSPDVNEDDICQNLSIRTCLGAIENMEEGQEPIRALINSIVGAVAVVDLEVARNLQHERIEMLVAPTFSVA